MHNSFSRHLLLLCFQDYWCPDHTVIISNKHLKTLKRGFGYSISYFLTPFHANVLFLYPLKTPENHRFSDVFRGYRENVGVKWVIRQIELLRSLTMKNHSFVMKLRNYCVSYQTFFDAPNY